MQNDFRLLSLFRRCGCSASEVMRTDFELLIAVELLFKPIALIK
jgi:hypothetical protein